MNYLFFFRFRIENAGDLVIAGAVKDDTGWYRCEATNVAGTRTTHPVQIIVLGNFFKVKSKRYLPMKRMHMKGSPCNELVPFANVLEVEQ